MNGLHFDGHWKRGMYLRTVKNLSLTSHPPQYFSSALGEGWAYDRDLDDSEVPLGDHLILDVLAPDNKRIARMSFSLSEKSKVQLSFSTAESCSQLPICRETGHVRQMKPRPAGAVTARGCEK